MNLRRFLFLLFAVLVFGSPGFGPVLFGQSLAKTFTLTAASQNACIGTSNLPTIGIDLSGTASLTLQPQVSINGSAPKTSSVTSTIAGSTAQATIVLSGSTAASFIAPVGGFDTFCLNVSAYTSGAITVVLNPSPAVNASLLGGDSSSGTATGLANAGNTVTLTASGIDLSTVNAGSLGMGDQPTSPLPGSDDDCIFGPYVTGASSNGIVCTGANGSYISIDNAAVQGNDEIVLNTGTPAGIIVLQADGNDSQQGNSGWYSSGTMSSEMHALSARCAAVGSAASPSVVDCQTGCGGVVGCAGGAFSCATNASGATCTVDTKRVCVDSGGGCANSLQTTSTIFITQVSDEGSALGVTCNTTPTSFLRSARVNATSFTLTLGVFTVNPLCFNFEIN